MPHKCLGCSKIFGEGTDILAGCPVCGGRKFQFVTTRELSSGKVEWPEFKPGEKRLEVEPQGDPMITSAMGVRQPPQTRKTASTSTGTGSRLSWQKMAAEADLAGTEGLKDGQEPGEGISPSNIKLERFVDTGSIERNEEQGGILEAKRAADQRFGAHGLAEARSGDDAKADTGSNKEDVGLENGGSHPASRGSPESMAEGEETEAGGQKKSTQEGDTGRGNDLGSGPSLESIRIHEPGTYELNLPSLFSREELVMAMKDGSYMIDLNTAFRKPKKSQ